MAPLYQEDNENNTIGKKFTLKKLKKVNMYNPYYFF